MYTFIVNLFCISLLYISVCAYLHHTTWLHPFITHHYCTHMMYMFVVYIITCIFCIVLGPFLVPYSHNRYSRASWSTVLFSERIWHLKWFQNYIIHIGVQHKCKTDVCNKWVHKVCTINMYNKSVHVHQKCKLQMCTTKVYDMSVDTCATKMNWLDSAIYVS